MRSCYESDVSSFAVSKQRLHGRPKTSRATDRSVCTGNPGQPQELRTSESLAGSRKRYNSVTAVGLRRKGSEGMKHLPADSPGIPARPWMSCRGARLRHSLPLVLFAAGYVAAAAEPTLLEPGKTIERQLAGGQSHEFSFTLQAGQYARISVEQRSINVAVAV